MIILASASPRRAEIMDLLGLPFRVCPSGCGEKTEEKDPEKMVMELSGQKALAAADSAGCNDLIIGADTAVSLERRILGKPKNREDAFSMLKYLSGKTHRVYTGVTIIKLSSGKIVKNITFAEKTDVQVASMTDNEISAYLDCGEYTDKAGGYGIQGRFAPFITGINGDYYNVMGLPASSLYRHLKEMEK